MVGARTIFLTLLGGTLIQVGHNIIMEWESVKKYLGVRLQEMFCTCSGYCMWTASHSLLLIPRIMCRSYHAAQWPAINSIVRDVGTRGAKQISQKSRGAEPPCFRASGNGMTAYYNSTSGGSRGETLTIKSSRSWVEPRIRPLTRCVMLYVKVGVANKIFVCAHSYCQPPCSKTTSYATDSISPESISYMYSYSPPSLTIKWSQPELNGWWKWKG